MRKAVVASSIAVAATGVAVTGGVLGDVGSGPAPTPAAADLGVAAVDLGSTTSDLGSTTSAGEAAAAGDAAAAPRVDALDRAPVVSRSLDRSRETDPAKEAALSVNSGPAVTRSVELSAADPRDIARAMLPEFGFSSDQFSCLDSLWTRESNWNPAAQNSSSGAFGIPQSLPGSKMASAGADWATNPATQIEWGLGYIRDRYGSPCGAWAHSESSGWY